MIRYPVDGRRGDVDKALCAVPQRSIEDVAGALHVGGVDVLRRVERQGRRGVDDEVGAIYSPVHQGFVPDVALDDLDPLALWIVKLLNVERGNAVAPGEEVPREVDPQKPGSSGDENSLLVHKSESPCVQETVGRMEASASGEF